MLIMPLSTTVRVERVAGGFFLTATGPLRPVQAFGCLDSPDEFMGPLDSSRFLARFPGRSRNRGRIKLVVDLVPLRDQ